MKRRKKTEKGYRSQAEERFAEYLELIGVKFSYEDTKLFYIRPASKHSYTPDFNLGRMYIEFKGRLTGADRKKMVLVKEQYPNLDIRLIFMQDNFIKKGSNTRYSRWAEKNGFKYHIGASLPKKWLKELI